MYPVGVHVNKKMYPAGVLIYDCNVGKHPIVLERIENTESRNGARGDAFGAGMRCWLPDMPARMRGFAATVCLVDERG